MADLGGDNRQQNTPAEIYRNVRNKALEEAAKIADSYNQDGNAIAASLAAKRIRALKSKEPA